MSTTAVEQNLSWIETAVDSGCPEWAFQTETRSALLTVLQVTRDEAGPDAVQAVADRLVQRARVGRPPSATQARKIARDELRSRDIEIGMSSPLARSSMG